MRTLIPILALACLVLVGCGEPQWRGLSGMQGTLDSMVVLLQPLPCPPETVTLLVKIDSTTYYDSGAEHHWSYVSPDTVFAMPPGEWVTIPKLRREHYPWPDSVFIPRKE